MYEIIREHIKYHGLLRCCAYLIRDMFQNRSFVDIWNREFMPVFHSNRIILLLYKTGNQQQFMRRAKQSHAACS